MATSDFSGSDIGNDHMLLMMEMRITMKRIQNGKEKLSTFK